MNEFDESYKLLSEYFEVQNEQEALDHRMKEIKTQLTALVQSVQGKKISFEKVGTVQWVEGKTSYRYDADILDQIKDQALRDGDMQTANAIANAQKPTNRVGSLRIVKSK